MRFQKLAYMAVVMTALCGGSALALFSADRSAKPAGCALCDCPCCANGCCGGGCCPLCP